MASRNSVVTSTDETAPLRSCATSSPTGNSVIGAFTTISTSDVTQDVSRSLTDAVGTTLTTTETALSDSSSTQTGNQITGLYTDASSVSSEVTTTHRTETTDGLHDFTAVNAVFIGRAPAMFAAVKAAMATGGVIIDRSPK